MADTRFIVVVGVPSIKKYVFGTDRLKEIRGASALLNDFNRFKMVEFLKESSEVSNVNCVFTGGGAGQFIMHSDVEKLQNCMKKLEALFNKETKGGARLYWGKSEYSEGNYQEALRLAEMEAKKKDEEIPFIPATQLHTGFIRECDSCSRIAAYLPFEDINEKRILCDVCLAKVTYNYENAKGDLWQDLARYLKQRRVTLSPPQSFNEIGEQSQAKKGYTALVYADGNSMGKIINTINDENVFKVFSEIVDSTIREACYEALYEIFFTDSNKAPKIMPAEILMLGGDDLMVYLTAESAFPFAIKVAEKFTEKSRKNIASSPHRAFFDERLAGKGLTISIGLVYGKSNTPFSILLGQAEELLKSAKKAGSKDERSGKYFAPSYMDYHLSTSFNQVRVEDTRKIHFEHPGRKTIRLYQKPYSLEKAKLLFNSANNLVKAGIPSTRLKRLGYAPTLGKMNGTLECLRIYTRTDIKQRQVIWDTLAQFNCVQNMPWNEGEKEDTTVLIDLMEIVGFCFKNE